MHRRWGLQHVPFDILETIAGFADIDSRRAMGFPPRRIAQDMLQHINGLLERKYSTRYIGDGQITTFLVTGKTDRTTSGMYLCYAYDRDYLTIIHTNGILRVFNNIDNIQFSFNTADIVRSTQYNICNAFEGYPYSTTLINCGIVGHLTQQNFEILRPPRACAHGRGVAGGA